MNAVTMIALYVTLIIIGPVFSIWAVNTLFSMTIPLNIYTWMSAAWLQIVLTNGSKKVNE